jgi:hypothetical protein
VRAAPSRASCARPFGLFLHPLAAPQGPHFGGILPQKQRQRLACDFRQRERFGCTARNVTPLIALQ